MNRYLIIKMSNFYISVKLFTLKTRLFLMLTIFGADCNLCLPPIWGGGGVEPAMSDCLIRIRNTSKPNRGQSKSAIWRTAQQNEFGIGSVAAGTTTGQPSRLSSVPFGQHARFSPVRPKIPATR